MQQPQIIHKRRSESPRRLSFDAARQFIRLRRQRLARQAKTPKASK